MLIRKIDYMDLEECSDLLREEQLRCFDGEYPSMRYLEDLLEDSMSFLIQNGCDIIGCVFSERLKHNGALLNFIAIHRDWRGKGLGSELLNRLQTEYEKKDIEWFILYSSVDIQENLSFYKKHNLLNNGLFYEMGKNL
jgi:ribosomal protein S18 acetylase RimI-like enzyme